MLASLTARQIQEIALAHRIEKTAYLIAALLLTISFAVSIVAIRTRTGPATRPSTGASSMP